MPGYDVTRSDVKNTALFDKYQCPHCHRLLKNAVQSSCGHWLCESCADALLESDSPKCPRSDCQEHLMADSEDGSKCFPDRFVRQEIEGMIVCCTYRQKGCKWKGRLVKLEEHLSTCKYAYQECPYCKQILAVAQIWESHRLSCPQALIECPLAVLGFPCNKVLLRQCVGKHVHKDHVEFISSFWKYFPPAVKSDSDGVKLMRNRDWPSSNQTMFSEKLDWYGGELPPSHLHGKLAWNPEPLDFMVNNMIVSHYPMLTLVLQKVECEGDKVIPEEETQAWNHQPANVLPDEKQLQSQAVSNVSNEQKCDLEQKKSTLRLYEDQVTREEMKVKNALCDYGNGEVVLKVSEVSQKMANEQQYVSSLPFAAQGYKLCFRAYLNGAGAGKGTHISLFIVIMKGEYDNFLLWPFDHNVTFKLINQAGGSHITYTFQPDPMNSSFQKPESDMNIDSSCPCFASHTEIKNEGFIVDDTMFIKCIANTRRVRDP